MILEIGGLEVLSPIPLSFLPAWQAVRNEFNFIPAASVSGRSDLVNFLPLDLSIHAGHLTPNEAIWRTTMCQ
jgi:hypothetical protein